jgi:thioredoxin reductase
MAGILAAGLGPEELRSKNRRRRSDVNGGSGRLSARRRADGAFYHKMDVAVIGGGDSAAEGALFLTRFARKVFLVHRRDMLRASKIMADRAGSHEKNSMRMAQHTAGRRRRRAQAIVSITSIVRPERRDISILLGIGRVVVEFERAVGQRRQGIRKRIRALHG